MNCTTRAPSATAVPVGDVRCPWNGKSFGAAEQIGQTRRMTARRDFMWLRSERISGLVPRTYGAFDFVEGPSRSVDMSRFPS